MEEYFAGDNADNKSVSKLMTPMITFFKFSRAEMNATTAFFLPEQFRVCQCLTALTAGPPQCIRCVMCIFRGWCRV